MAEVNQKVYDGAKFVSDLIASNGKTVDYTNAFVHDLVKVFDKLKLNSETKPRDFDRDELARVMKGYSREKITMEYVELIRSVLVYFNENGFTIGEAYKAVQVAKEETVMNLYF